MPRGRRKASDSPPPPASDKPFDPDGLDKKAMFIITAFVGTMVEHFATLGFLSQNFKTPVDIIEPPKLTPYEEETGSTNNRKRVAKRNEKVRKENQELQDKHDAYVKETGEDIKQTIEWFHQCLEDEKQYGVRNENLSRYRSCTLHSIWDLTNKERDELEKLAPNGAELNKMLKLRGHMVSELNTLKELIKDFGFKDKINIDTHGVREYMEIQVLKKLNDGQIQHLRTLYRSTGAFLKAQTESGKRSIHEPSKYRQAAMEAARKLKAANDARKDGKKVVHNGPEDGTTYKLPAMEKILNIFGPCIGHRIVETPPIPPEGKGNHAEVLQARTAQMDEDVITLMNYCVLLVPSLRLILDAADRVTDIDSAEPSTRFYNWLSLTEISLTQKKCMNQMLKDCIKNLKRMDPVLHRQMVLAFQAKTGKDKFTACDILDMANPDEEAYELLKHEDTRNAHRRFQKMRQIWFANSVSDAKKEKDLEELNKTLQTEGFFVEPTIERDGKTVSLYGVKVPRNVSLYWTPTKRKCWNGADDAGWTCVEGDTEDGTRIPEGVMTNNETLILYSNEDYMGKDNADIYQLLHVFIPELLRQVQRVTKGKPDDEIRWSHDLEQEILNNTYRTVSAAVVGGLGGKRGEIDPFARDVVNSRSFLKEYYPEHSNADDFAFSGYFAGKESADFIMDPVTVQLFYPHYLLFDTDGTKLGTYTSHCLQEAARVMMQELASSDKGLGYFTGVQGDRYPYHSKARAGPSTRIIISAEEKPKRAKVQGETTKTTKTTEKKETEKKPSSKMPTFSLPLVDLNDYADLKEKAERAWGLANASEVQWNRCLAIACHEYVQSSIIPVFGGQAPPAKGKGQKKKTFTVGGFDQGRRNASQLTARDLASLRFEQQREWQNSQEAANGNGKNKATALEKIRNHTAQYEALPDDVKAKHEIWEYVPIKISYAYNRKASLGGVHCLWENMGQMARYHYENIDFFTVDETGSRFKDPWAQQVFDYVKSNPFEMYSIMVELKPAIDAKKAAAASGGAAAASGDPEETNDEVMDEGLAGEGVPDEVPAVIEVPAEDEGEEEDDAEEPDAEDRVSENSKRLKKSKLPKVEDVQFQCGGPKQWIFLVACSKFPMFWAMKDDPNVGLYLECFYRSFVCENASMRFAPGAVTLKRKMNAASLKSIGAQNMASGAQAASSPVFVMGKTGDTSSKSKSGKRVRKTKKTEKTGASQQSMPASRIVATPASLISAFPVSDPVPDPVLAPAAAPTSPAVTVSDQRSPARTVRDRPSPEDSDDRSSKIPRTTSTDGLAEPADGEPMQMETEEDGDDAGAQQHPATPPHSAEEAEEAEEAEDSDSDIDPVEMEFSNTTLQHAPQAMEQDSGSEEESEQEDEEDEEVP